MFVKLVSPDRRESQLYRVVEGYGTRAGIVDDLDDLDDFGEHEIQFHVGAPPYSYIEFLPSGQGTLINRDVKLAITSGRIYLQNDEGKTFDTVK